MIKKSNTFFDDNLSLLGVHTHLEYLEYDADGDNYEDTDDDSFVGDDSLVGDNVADSDDYDQNLQQDHT